MLFPLIAFNHPKQATSAFIINMITSGLVLLLLLLVVITVASLSPIPMITEVHITTLLSTFSPAEPKSCEDNCDIAYQYLIGVSSQ
jgi:hypothetical protein